MVDLIKNGDTFRHPGIYKIVNTKTGKIYIGSSVNMRKRLYEHFRLLRHGKHHCSYLQSSFNKHGEGCFDIEIIEIVNVDGMEISERDTVLLAREQFWLDKTRCYESNIGYNSSSKADKVSMSPETRAKIGKGRLGKKHTEESKAKMSAANKGRVIPEETRKKMSIANKGRPISDSHRQRISESKKGVPRSEETKRKLSEARKGMRPTEETRAKMSASQTGRKHSEESRRKISESRTGLKLSEDSRKKLLETRKANRLMRQKLKEEQAIFNS